jgi:sugar phosphate isomerase/epimerase
LARWKNRFAGHLGLRAPDAPLFRHLCPSTDVVDQVNFLADLGFAGVQDNFLTLRTPADQSRIGAAVVARGMEMGSFVHDPLKWNLPTWNRDDDDARTAAWNVTLDAARRSGSRTVNCVTGFDSSAPRAAQITHMVRNLSACAESAAALGLVLCVEATNAAYLPGMLVDDLAEAVAMVNEIDLPAVKLMFDIGHIAMNGQNVQAAIQIMADRIGAVQAADVSEDGATRVDLGAGMLDWPAILGALRAAGYTGLIEIEHMPLVESAAGEQSLIDRLRDIDSQS